jgi:predicted ester cyclase
MRQTLAVDERAELARDYVRVVFNGHQPDRASDYCTDDVVWHGNSLGEVSGVENLTALLTAFLGALPDLVAEEQDVIASDDLVVVRLIVTATHRGDLLGIPATGRRVQWNAIDIYGSPTTGGSAKNGPLTTWRRSRASSVPSRFRGRPDPVTLRAPAKGSLICHECRRGSIAERRKQHDRRSDRSRRRVVEKPARSGGRQSPCLA